MTMPLAAAISDLTVAEKLLKALEDSGMTQVEVATKLADPESDERRIENLRRLLNKWLAGKHTPGRKHAQRLALIFETDPDYFLGDQPGRGRAGSVDSESRELLSLVWDAAAVSFSTHDWDEIPKDGFRKDFVAKQLARNFTLEHILVDEVVAWRALEYVCAKATFDERTLGLGQWYTDSDLIPGMVLLEALAQVSSIAMLTHPTFRRRLIFFAGYNQPRIKRIVHAGETLILTAELVELHGQIAHYKAEARIDDDLAVRATVIIAAH